MMIPPAVRRLLPFLRWWPYGAATLRADLVAGLTVALVLVPQSMAYAQLAGLPAYVGLYAGFLPVMVAALWGSSNQLGTGPVAVVSLLTASSLGALAPPGSESFIALAVMLALMIGVMQLSLGLFRLGAVVNFLSHPVILGFTNAAALIIALSQLNKLVGVPMERSGHLAADLWGVVQNIDDAHLPTLAMGAAAGTIILLMRRFVPKVPGVLVAVALTTLASWQFGFEQRDTVPLQAIDDPQARHSLATLPATESRLAELSARQAQQRVLLEQAKAASGELSTATLVLEQQGLELRLRAVMAQQAHDELQRLVGRIVFERVLRDGQVRFVPAGPAIEGGNGQRWRVKGVKGEQVTLSGGGDVVGRVPQGLPSFGMPALSLGQLVSLLPAALVIALVGFMEAISIAKSMAARTRDRIDPNQELVGQGLANVVSALSQGFPVSGSFSRSAVNLGAGARTGMSSVYTGLLMLLTLLFLTPLLYHLPQATLAAVIIVAVVGLVDVAGVREAWQVHRHDGIAAVVTFLATLVFAPNLELGIMVGAGLAIVLYLLRTMKPRVAILGRHHDGTLRDAAVHQLPTSDLVTAVRFDGSLFFANVAYFEDTILQAVAANPKARTLLVVGDGINELDASGEEVMHHLVERLRGAGVTMVFSGLKQQVVEVMRATGLLALVGEDRLYPTADAALEAIYATSGDAAHDDPLRPRPPA